MRNAVGLLAHRWPYPCSVAPRSARGDWRDGEAESQTNGFKTALAARYRICKSRYPLISPELEGSFQLVVRTRIFHAERRDARKSPPAPGSIVQDREASAIVRVGSAGSSPCSDGTMLPMVFFTQKTTSFLPTGNLDSAADYHGFPYKLAKCRLCASESLSLRHHLPC